MMEYDVIAHWTFGIFVDEVNQAINNGWKPIGGISVAVLHDGAMQYYQAVVRVEPVRVDMDSNPRRVDMIQL